MKTVFSFIVCISILLIACDRSIPETPVDHSSSITHIEMGLLPNIAIEGEPSTTWQLSERMKHHNVPGVSIAFFNQGAIQWTRTYGYLAMDSLNQVDSQTMFQAASISKPVATLAALTMVEEGLLNLDQPANQYLKDWQIPDNQFTRDNPIDFRNLVTHSGGLTVHGFRGYAQGEEVPTTIQVLEGSPPANSDPVLPDTFPNALWRYSGGGYTVAQKVMTDVTEQDFHEIMEERVLERVSMNRSTYQQPLPEVYQDNAAIGYRGNGEQVMGKWHTYPEQAAAGLWTTPSDLARLAIHVQRAYSGEQGHIISSEMANEMLTKHLGDWGLGFRLNGAADSLQFGHGGANEGYRCNLMAFANMGPGVAIMTNGDNGGSLSSEILRAISKEYNWNVFNQEVKKVVELSADELEGFAGNYNYLPDPEISISIKVTEGQLVISQLWDDLSYTIYPEGKLLFFDYNEGTPFQFEKGEDGAILKVIVDGGFELIKTKE